MSASLVFFPQGLMKTQGPARVSTFMEAELQLHAPHPPPGYILLSLPFLLWKSWRMGRKAGLSPHARAFLSWYPSQKFMFLDYKIIYQLLYVNQNPLKCDAIWITVNSIIFSFIRRLGVQCWNQSVLHVTHQRKSKIFHQMASYYNSIKGNRRKIQSTEAAKYPKETQLSLL